MTPTLDLANERDSPKKGGWDTYISSWGFKKKTDRPPFTGARQFHHDFFGENSLRKSHHILSYTFHRLIQKSRASRGKVHHTLGNKKYNASCTVLLDIAHC